MGVKAGLGLKFVQWFVRGVQFCSAALILAIYAYFLSALHSHSLSIATSVRAVAGITGAAALYSLVGLLLLCCVAGLAFTSFVAIVLDVCFIGAFVYVAIANKGGASSCRGYIDTPFGKGDSSTTVQGSHGFTALPSFHTACRLQTACLSVAIIAIFFFIFSILMELALARHHRKEKRYGPGPRNDYTSGYGRTRGGFLGRIFGRRKAAAADESNMLPQHSNPDQLDNRTSYATETTTVNHDHANPYSNSDGSPSMRPATVTTVFLPPLGSGGNNLHGRSGVHYVPHNNNSNNNNNATYGAPQNRRYGDGVYNNA